MENREFNARVIHYMEQSKLICMLLNVYEEM